MDLLTFEDSEQLAEAAATRFLDIGRSAVEAQGRFCVALAGGSTPKRVYRLLASPELKGGLDWTKTQIFFGDERCVPPDHPESNYRTAREALLSRVPVPPGNVHPMIGEGDPQTNALGYELELRGLFVDAVWPRFDLVMLGLGDDGHTASLFPATAALNETYSWVAANWVEQLKAFRITLTAPAISHAANIIFLVSGENKAQALFKVLREASEPDRLPAQLIQPVDGRLEWFVDKAAAALL